TSASAENPSKSSASIAGSNQASRDASSSGLGGSWNVRTSTSSRKRWRRTAICSTRFLVDSRPKDATLRAGKLGRWEAGKEASASESFPASQRPNFPALKYLSSTASGTNWKPGSSMGEIEIAGPRENQ